MDLIKNNPESLEYKIKAEAYRLGFNLCGITSADTPANYNIFSNWLEAGFNAGSIYLKSERHRMFRNDLSLLMPGVKSIICLGFPYPLFPIKDFPVDSGWIAGYVMEEDYHVQIPVIAELLIDFIRKLSGKEICANVFTDSSPILERELAVRSGLGWIGKNSNFISPIHGSNMLLAEIFLDIPLTEDFPFKRDLCGNCQICIDACPTNCIQPNRTIDSRSCISYLTIENKQIVDLDLRTKICNWIFGCDVCQQVCPWNHKRMRNLNQNKPTTFTINKMVSILNFEKEQFDLTYGNTSLARRKFSGIQQNMLIALGNIGQKRVIPKLENIRDTSLDPEIIRTANWAIEQLLQGKK